MHSNAIVVLHRDADRIQDRVGSRINPVVRPVSISRRAVFATPGVPSLKAGDDRELLIVSLDFRATIVAMGCHRRDQRMRHLFQRNLLGWLCTIFITVGVTLQVAHTHPDRAVHSDCVYCHAVHSTVQPSIFQVSLFVARPIARVFLAPRPARTRRFFVFSLSESTAPRSRFVLLTRCGSVEVPARLQPSRPGNHSFVRRSALL